MIRAIAIEQSGFDGRMADLAAVLRWNRFAPNILYPSNDLLHSESVAAFYRQLEPLLMAVFDGRIVYAGTELLAHVHDDHETVRRHDQSYHLKKRMPADELAEFERQELQDIQDLGERRPETVFGHNYVALMREAKEKRTVRAQLVSYIDRLVDGFGEALHEVAAGNEGFLQPLDAYLAMRDGLLQDDLQALATVSHPLLQPPTRDQINFIKGNPQRHTLTSVHEPTGVALYDAWRRTRINLFGPMVLVKPADALTEILPQYRT